MVTLLRANSIPVTTVDTGEGTSSFPRLLRIVRAIQAFFHALVTPHRDIYLSVNANAGMIFTCLYAAVARLRGKGISLHHHTFAAISRRSKLARLLVRSAGPHALHFTNCRAMAEILQDSLPGVRNVASFSNVGLVEAPPATHRSSMADSVMLGHMSNLTEEKGIGRAIEVLEQLDAAGVKARLLVAGPIRDAYSRAAIDSALRRFPRNFEYLGALAGEQKSAFFSRLDFFLFPSLYPNETQGIVLLEALAHGVPVVAYHQCCIQGDVAGLGGCVLKRTVPFAPAAVDYLQVAGLNKELHRANARSRYEELLEAHAAERDWTVRHFRGEHR